MGLLWTVAISVFINMAWVKNPLCIKLLVRVIGGHTSKIHLAVDACGNPIEFIITAGKCKMILLLRLIYWHIGFK